MNQKMEEITTAIVLAAGSSRRMGEMTKDKPKCLLPYKDEMILNRLIRQLKECGIKKVVLTVGYKKERVIEAVDEIKDIEIMIVENNLYDKDVNIYSMKLALEKVDEPCVIYEADTIMEDHLVQYVKGSDFEGKSVWFTRGPFLAEQYGGILNSNDYGNIINIKIVLKYEDKFKDYRKLTGLMRIGPNEIKKFKELIDEYAEKSIEQYYLIPWIENLDKLPCIEGNVEHYIFESFNKPEKYISLLDVDFDQKEPEEQKIELIDVRKLKHIENYDEERVENLLLKISKEGIWTRPLYIEKNHNLVLDGQHRLQVALRLGLKYVPVQGFNYEDVRVWTLRKEEKVDIKQVIERANKGDIYPYKTVKHKFPQIISACNIPLEELKEDKK